MNCEKRSRSSAYSCLLSVGVRYIAYSIIQSCFERVEHVTCAQCLNVSCFGRELLLSDYNHLEYGVVDEDRDRMEVLLLELAL